jgi:uncharacterized protein
MDRKIIKDELIKPKNALAWIVKKDQYLRIIDVEGKQVGDFVVINEHDHTEQSNTAWTLQDNAGSQEFWAPALRFRFNGITTGHKIISSLGKPMLTVTADTPVPSGTHDLQLRFCRADYYDAEGLEAQAGCFELSSEVLAPYGIKPGSIANGINIFQSVTYDHANGMVKMGEPVTRPGDYIEFRAEMDCLCSLTACPDNISSNCNGNPPHPAKPLRIQVSEEV